MSGKLQILVDSNQTKTHKLPVKNHLPKNKCPINFPPQNYLKTPKKIKILSGNPTNFSKPAIQ
jgi:hypothetical protein